MFVKLAVFACSVAAALAAWHGPLAGGQPASLYPAGVSPQACPNFPNCDNPAVAIAGSQSHGAWNGAGAGAGGWNGGANAGAWNGGHAGQWNGGDNGQWNGGNNGQWNGGNNGQWNGGWNGGHSQEALNNGEYIGDGDYHGEGLAESGAYGGNDNGNQGNWNNGNHGNWNAAPAVPAYGHQAAAAVPAGVDAHSCPNYPFCH